MTTLRIEHEISDYGIWKTAFDSFAAARAQAGVDGIAIRQPVDDPRYVLLDLEFETRSRAEAFEQFLQQHVWSSPTSAPGLAGEPRTRILDVMSQGNG